MEFKEIHWSLIVIFYDESKEYGWRVRMARPIPKFLQTLRTLTKGTYVRKDPLQMHGGQALLNVEQLLRRLRGDLARGCGYRAADADL